MTGYFALKWIHVVSSTLLFGTGLGTAFFMWMAHRNGNVAAIAVTARHVVLADWLFTAPAALIQPLSGLALMRWIGYPFDLPWVVAAAVLYVLAGACWLKVLAIQLRVQRLAQDAHARAAPLPPEYHRQMRLWFTLGWPAFVAFLAIFWLMVARPALWG